MPAMKREVRMLSGAQLRAKADKPGAEGYAAVFNEVADLGWFKETIKPGAFRRAISEKQDVRCLQNHNEDLILGRTKSNTLTLREDDTGLAFDCDFPDTQNARDLRTLMMRKDIDQCSFGFIVRTQTWRQNKLEDGSIEEIREIEDVDLMDVSIVTFPAYEGTSCEARALWPDGIPLEVRAHRPRREKRNALCECGCPECEDGDCEECSNDECDDPNCEGHDGSRQPRGGRADEKKPKRVDGEDLTSDCFLIVGDPDDTSTWKLPWKFSTNEKTKSHLRNALARFNQLKGVSDEDKAWKKLVKLCKQYDIEVSEENSLRRHLTEQQLRELRQAADEDTRDADCLEACQQSAHQIKINVEEIGQAITRAVEDSGAAISSCKDEFEEIARLAAEAIEECNQFSGQIPDSAGTERARAIVRAIEASL
jgi:Escherichia/Staphylococcus phage prohead protease